MKNLIMKVIVTTLIVLTISSCSVAPKKGVQEQAVNDAIQTPDAWAAIVAKNADQHKTPAKWLESFNDPLLLKLIAEGKANNLDLQVAAGNMDIAWLLAKQSGAALKPTASLSLGTAQSSTANSGSSSGQANVGLQASWEIDVWGRLRAGVDAAHASAQAADADYTFAQHSLAANIATTYFIVIEAKQQADITQKNLGILTETMRITQVKYDNGMSSAQDVALNRANLASAKEQLITIEGSQRTATRALEVLLGRYPNAALEIPSVLPSLPAQPPAGIPSQILERRPDIVSAERQIARAFNATTQAKAARLPSFKLTADVGGTSSSLSDILSPSNVAWKLAGNLLAPIFDGGRRKIDVKIANVEQKQAIANYANSALAAFSEVENNLDEGGVLAKRELAKTKQ